MDDSEGNRSLTLNDAMGGGSNHTANTETFANNAQVRALGMVLEGSAGGAMDADMLAKQHAAIGRVSTAPGAHAIEADEESVEFFTAPPDLDFEMSSTTRFAQMGQQMALEGIADVDALDLAKQRARAGVGPDRSVSTPPTMSRVQTVAAGEQMRISMIQEGTFVEENVATAQLQTQPRQQRSLEPGAYAMRGASVVSYQTTGALTDASSSNRDSRARLDVNSISDLNAAIAMKSATAGATTQSVVGAKAQPRGEEEMAPKEQPKKDPNDEAPSTHCELAPTPKNRLNRKWIIGISLLVLVMIIVGGVGVGIGVGEGGGSSLESSPPTSAPEPSDPICSSDPSLEVQCLCFDEITSVSEITQDRYDALRALVPMLDGETSCSGENLVLFRIAEDSSIDISDEQSIVERFALLTLVQGAGRPDQWQLPTWTSAAPVCEWEGIVCGNEGVSEIKLTSLNITGILPDRITLLTSLEVLDISDNFFSGTIPSEMMSLPLLRKLLMNQNELSGQIPTEAGLATSLESFRASNNNLGGTIPTEIGNLGAVLEVFSVHTCRIGGVIPSELGRLTNANTLELYKNREIGGDIPTELAQLQLLDSLILDLMQVIRGKIPTEITTIANLQVLSITATDVSGSIPTEVGNLESLQILALDHARVGGSIPSELGNLSALQHLLLASERRDVTARNFFSGTLPTQLWNLTNLVTLDLGSQGKLTGTIASELFELPDLKVARFRGNRFSGTIPVTLLDATELECLDVSGNSILEGTVPAGACDNPNLVIAVGCFGGNTSMLEGCDCCECGDDYDPCDPYLSGFEKATSRW